jgi:hypothetical protein
MNCEHSIIIVLLVVIVYILLQNSKELFDFVMSPFLQYYPKEQPSYIGSNEPNCNLNYGYFDRKEDTKIVDRRAVNSKVRIADQDFNAYCNPYVLNKELMFCISYNKDSSVNFQGMMPKKC